MDSDGSGRRSDRLLCRHGGKNCFCRTGRAAHYAFSRRIGLQPADPVLLRSRRRFLTLADLLSRLINYPFETPIEVVTSVIGVPFFLYLIKRKGGSSVPKKVAVIYAVFIVLILTICYLSITVGSFAVHPAELLLTLLHINPNEQYAILLFELRLPRIVTAALVGLGLGIAGSVIQAMTRNGLADPGILGINAGAGRRSSATC